MLAPIVTEVVIPFVVACMASAFTPMAAESGNWLAAYTDGQSVDVGGIGVRADGESTCVVSIGVVANCN